MGSKIVEIALTMMFLLVVFHFKIVGSTHYMVGDGFGWDFVINMQTWPRGKKFYVGDVLEFKYDYQSSDMVIVKAKEYTSCTHSDEDQIFESGDDKITLGFGITYFSTSYHEHCQAGLKMIINATTRPPVNKFLLH
ncbi:early nodulin-like protein 22 [Euphorbia peplus]|nr:early nodulin-like protein 22 [Euphorbia peplus]